MKKKGRFLFETTLKWEADKKGILSSRVIGEKIKVTVPQLNSTDEKGLWSPEHLLISAVNSGFMTAFMYHARIKQLSICAFECEVIGQVELKNERLKFTEINVYPKVVIESPEAAKKANEVIELTKQHCLIARALNVITYYHPIVELNKKNNSAKKTQGTTLETR